jgi:hypothetical protein
MFGNQDKARRYYTLAADLGLVRQAKEGVRRDDREY